MAHPIYYVPAGDVLPVFFGTYGKTNGESLTMTGLAVTDIEIYKDGSTTQRSSDAGYTLLDTDGIDFDGLTGIHGFSIDTGDNTDASFYTVGAWFTVVVSAITIDSQTVSFIAAQFRIMPAEGVAGKPKVDTDTFGGSAGTFASGIPEVKVASLAANAITATSIASDAITAAKVADGTIDAATFAAGAITATVIATGAIDADALAADAVDEILDEVVEGSYTVRQLLRLMASALLGKASGLATTTAVYRDTGDSKNRISATVDADGNRSAVTLDAS